MAISDGFRMSLFAPNSRDADFVKQQAYRDLDIIVINLDDKRIHWEELQLLRNLGERLYGKKTPAGR